MLKVWQKPTDWCTQLTSFKRAAALSAILVVSACGNVSNDEAEQTETGQTQSETLESDLSTEEAADYSVSIDVPSDWYESDKAGFDYQYLWDGNDWDDILAQDFNDQSYDFTGDFFRDLLESNLPDAESITVRDDSAELGGYPAIIIDVTYTTDSYTSLTYVDVDGHLWEFTVNAQTQEGIERGEAINDTATFTP